MKFQIFIVVAFAVLAPSFAKGPCLQASDCKYNDDVCLNNLCVRTCSPDEDDACGSSGDKSCSTAPIDGNNICGRTCREPSACDSNRGETCQSGVCVRVGAVPTRCEDDDDCTGDQECKRDFCVEPRLRKGDKKRRKGGRN